MIAYLVEALPGRRTDGSQVILRYSNTSQHTRTAVGTWLPRLKVPYKRSTQVFDGAFSEQPQSYSSIEVAIQTGDNVAAIPALAWDGRRVRVWRGAPGLEPGAMELVFDGEAENVEAARGSFTINLRGPGYAASRDLLTSLYGGSGGYEGGANLANQPRPMALGRPLNVEPVYTDRPRGIFQYHGYGPAGGLTGVFDGGSELQYDGRDFATYAELETASVAGGYYCQSKALGMGRHGGQPIDVLTCDVIGAAATSDSLIGSILTYLAGRAGVPVRAETMSWLNTNLPHPQDNYVTEQTSIESVARDMMLKLGGYIWWTPNAEMSAGLVRRGAAPSFEVGRANIANLGVRQTSAPYFRRRMGYRRSWRVQTYAETRTPREVNPRGSYVATTAYGYYDLVSFGPNTWLHIGQQATTGVEPAEGAVWTKFGAGVNKTSQLEDDAGLGLTATWPSVTGIGKPTDYADVTATSTAAAISGQGALATKNAADYGSQVVGAQKPENNATVGAVAGSNLFESFGGSILLLNQIKTILGQAASFLGQGILATKNIVLSSLMGQQSDSIVPDGAFADTAWWGGPYPNIYTDPSDAGNTWELSPRLLRITPGDFDRFTDFFAVQPGGTYRIDVILATSGDFVGFLNPCIHVPGVAWFSLSRGGIPDPNDPNYSDLRSGSLYLRRTHTFRNQDANTNDNRHRQWQFRLRGTITAGTAALQVRITRMSPLGSLVTREDGATALSDALAVTGLGTAAGFFGQTQFATLAYGTSLDNPVFGLPERMAASGFGPAYFRADRIAYAEGNTPQGLKPAEAGANITENRSAASFYGQGQLATLNGLSYGSPYLGGFNILATLSSVRFNTSRITRADGSTQVDESLVVTQVGVAAAIAGQGTLATRSSVTGDDVRQGRIVSANGKTIIDLDNGRFITRDAGRMKVIGAAFGSTNQFTEWSGPDKASLDQCTEAQAIAYERTDGQAFFNGSLAEGQLRVQKNEYGRGLTQVAVGPQVTNGRARYWVASLAVSRSGSRQSNYGPQGNWTGQIVIEQLLPNGQWEQRGAPAALSGYYYNDQGSGGRASPDEPGNFDQAASCTTQFTDNSGGTTPFQIRARVTALNMPGVSGNANTADVESQTLNITSYEA